LPGHESAIQVATSEDPPAIGVPFDQSYENALVAELWWEQGWNQEGVIKGGLSEPTPVWVPHLGTHGKVRLFYRGLHGAPGTYWNWRISYADSDDGITGWVKNPVPTFDPSDPENPAHRWTQPPPAGFSFRGAWQAHCTGDTIAGGVHMILTVSNQNFAGHGHLAYYWSPDWGDTWFGHPDNPIIAPGQFENGVPASGFQRTPTLLVDDAYGRYVIAYNAGHDAQEPWRRRTYLAVASRPGGSTAAASPPPAGGGAVFRLLRAAPNPARGAVRLDLDLPRAGGLEVAIYAVTGRLVARLERLRAAAGRRSLTWSASSATAARQPLPAGVYYLRARLESPSGDVDIATGRVVLDR
jgi:hypothetical protein